MNETAGVLTLGNQHDCQFASDPRVNTELAASFKNLNILVSGGGRGIGRATAEFFAHTEARSLSLMALELSEVDETARICKEINPILLTKTAAFDVRDYSRVEQFVHEVDCEFGSIDVLFANAGRPPQFLSTHTSDPQLWWDTVAVSIQGSFNFSRAVLPHMRRNKAGRICFTASAGAHMSTGMSSYIVGKLGIVRLCENLHHENKDVGISVFCIHPGTIRTRLYTDYHDAAEGNIRNGGWISSTVKGEKESAENAVDFFKNSRWDAPQMPAGLVLALASGKLDFMSGRYVDSSRMVEDYIRDKDKIIAQDLFRVKLRVDSDLFLPPISQD